jgi:hypothetical protein
LVALILIVVLLDQRRANESALLEDKVKTLEMQLDTLANVNFTKLEKIVSQSNEYKKLKQLQGIFNQPPKGAPKNVTDRWN